MKQIKSKLLFFVCSVLFMNLAFSQVTLPEIVIASARYKYLSAVDGKEVAQPVKMLERMTAEYDIKNSEFYDDQYDEYYISFRIPKGYVLAKYDNNGKLLSTIERFQNVALPKAVTNSLVKKYPEWSIPKDVYKVAYDPEKGATKIWKVVLTKGDKRLRVTVSENGDIVNQ